MASEKKYQCIYCNYKDIKDKLASHISKKHLDELPESFTPMQATFHIVNKHPLNWQKPCRVCQQPCDWDEKKGRYNLLCNNKSCHEKWAEKMKKDMGAKMGSNRPTQSPEGLQKMLAARKISGKYTWSDGTVFTYVGSYERATLEFMDTVMEIKSEDIMVPGPVLEYMLDDKKHLYITDIFYIPYNLIIEVKDGGNNPNTNPEMYENRRKKLAKEKYVIEKTNYNYIRLTNKDFSQLLAVFADLKMNLVDKTNERVIHVNESSVNEGYLTSPGNLEINLDKWTQGVPLWICGSSGDGKSTLAQKYKDNNFDVDFICHTDILLCRLCWDKEKWNQRMSDSNSKHFNDYNTDIASRKYLEIMGGKLSFGLREKGKSWPTEKIRPYFINFFKWLIKECTSGFLKDKKFIVEGCDIWNIDPEYISTQPLIILNNPRIKAFIQRIKRSSSKPDSNLIKATFDQLKAYKNVRPLEDERDEFYNKTKKEYKKLNENMYPALAGALPPMSANCVYMVNYMRNTAFSPKSNIAVSDSPRFDSLYTIVDGVLKKKKKDFLKECKYNTYFVDNCKDRVAEFCDNNLDKEVSESSLYEAVFGHRLMMENQIEFEDTAVAYQDINYQESVLSKFVVDYITKGE